MLSFLEEVLIPVSVLAFTVSLIVMTMFVPIMYLDGSAKAKYLLKDRGVEYAWYEATFLPQSIFIDSKHEVTIK